MRLTEDARLMTLAASRHGVFTLDEWVEHGASLRALRRHVAAGRVRRIDRQVHAFAVFPPTWRQALAAAVLGCEGRAAASHRSAAFLWRMIDRQPPVEVVAPRHRRSKRAFVVHESTDLAEEHVTVVDGIPVTTPARTLVDLGAVAKGWVGGALDTALRLEIVTLAEVVELLQDVARKGRRGVGPLRPVLAERVAADALTDSYLESLFLAGVEAHRMPEPVVQYPVQRPDGSLLCVADFAYPAERLLVALDGMATHTERRRFQLDRSQQNEVELLGWMMLRYTWWDVTGAMWRVAEQVGAALAARRGSAAS